MGTDTKNPITTPRTAGNSASNTANALNNDAVKKEIDDFKDTLMKGVTKFLIEIASILALVLIWGFICANIIGFIRPDSDSKDSRFKNTIMDRLDQFFPHDIEKAPYGFDKTRGIANEDVIKKHEEGRKTLLGEDDDGDNDHVHDDADNGAEKCKFGKHFVFEKEDKTTGFPYTWSAQPLKLNQTDNKMYAPNDNEKTIKFIFDAPITSFKYFFFEWLVNGIYFSYGNTRKFIKMGFRWLHHYMKERTPSPLKDSNPKLEDPSSQYEYMSNLMVMLHIPLLFIFIILPFFGFGIGAIMMVAGSFWNQLPIGEEFKLFKFLEGIGMTLVLGSFTVMPFAAAAYFIQPAMFFGKLLFYQLFCEGENLAKTFVEIIPSMITIFTLGICFSAFYNFPDPFNYLMVIAAIIAYCILFKDKLSNLFMFLGMMKANILKTKTISTKASPPQQ